MMTNDRNLVELRLARFDRRPIPKKNVKKIPWVPLTIIFLVVLWLI